MSENTDAATILTAIRDLIDADILQVQSECRERSVGFIDEAIETLINTGQADSSQIRNYDVDKEFRSDFAHALFGPDRVLKAMNEGRYSR